MEAACSREYYMCIECGVVVPRERLIQVFLKLTGAFIVLSLCRDVKHLACVTVLRV